MRPLVFVLLVSVACTVDAAPAGDDTADPAPDAAPDPVADCALPAELGAAMSNLTAERHNQPGSMGARQYYRLLGDFDAAATPDRLDLELWDQTGAFTGDVAAGTYTIGGVETSLETCGVCVMALADFTPPAEQFYIAQTGTVTITSVEPTLAGSLSGVTLAQFDPATGALVAGGCTATVPTLDFSAPVTIVDVGGGGGGGGG